MEQWTCRHHGNLLHTIMKCCTAKLASRDLSKLLRYWTASFSPVPDGRSGLCRDLDHKLASTEAQVNELRAHLASASGSGKPSPVFRISGSPIPGPFQLQSSMIPRSGPTCAYICLHLVYSRSSQGDNSSKDHQKGVAWPKISLTANFEHGQCM